MESLISWKKKRDKYDDEADEDDSEIRCPRLVDSMQESNFIMRDEANAKSMRKMGFRSWW